MSSDIAPVIPKRKAAASSAKKEGARPGHGIGKHLPVERSQTTGAQQASESSFQLLFSNNPYPMYVYDAESLRFLAVNAAAIKQYGYSREEFLEMRITEIRPPDEVPRLLAFIKSRPAGLHSSGHWQHRRKDGRILDVEVTRQTLSFGGQSAVLVLAQDITKSKLTERKIEERTAYLHALIENNPLAVVVFDSHCHVQMCNPAFEQLFQYSHAEMVGANLDEMVAPKELGSEAAQLSRMAVAGRSVRATARRRRKDGILVDVAIHSVPLMVNGQLTGGFGIYEDITERKRAEEALASLSRRNDMILNAVGEGIFGLDLDGKQTFVNRAGAKMLGYEPEEMAGRHGHSTWHHSKADGSPYPVQECPIYAAFRDGVVRHVIDEVFWRKDGTSFPVEYTSTPIQEGNKVVGAVVTFRDITERKRAFGAKQQAEERFRGVFDNTVEGIFQATPDGKYLSMNPALARMYGYGSQEELTASVKDGGHPKYVDPARRTEFERLMGELGVVEGFEYQAYRKDGSKIWLSENSRAVRDAQRKLLYYEGTVEDITARKRAEIERQVSFEIIHGVNVTDNLDELLRLIHQSLKKVLYAENCFVALYDPKAGMFNFPFFADQFDTVPPPQKLGKSCTAHVFRTGRAMLIPQKAFDQLAEQGEVELVGTPSPTWLGVPLRTPSETIGVLVVQHYEDKNAYTERDLEFIASVGGQIAVAIERKRAEAALRESEARLRVLVEQLPAVLWTTDAELRFTSSLGAGLARLGLKQNEVVGMSLYEYFHTEDPEFLPIAAHRRAIAGDAVTFHVEWGGGSYACHVEPLRSADGQPQGAICMALDITDRKQLEAQLRQAQKMEAVGRLAGGIAHDFNNLLMVIRGYSELLLERIGTSDPMRRNVEQIHSASDRAASLTRQLLAFSRKQVLAPKVLNMHSVVADMEKILRRLIGEDIELVTVTPQDLWDVKADRSQIEQVILNLAVNARDAMPQGGKLTIETANVELDSGYARQHPVVTPGEFMMPAVTDTGCGMDAETQAHIFEPFFTTKEKGKGTGLGLATVYGVVKQSGGHVWVYSEPGQGTTFKIYLPRVAEAAEAKEKTQDLEGLRRGTETILLVEDEKGVRELAREYLELSGYRVLEAEGGAEAIQLVKKQSRQIHLLLTDVVMPGMSGRELAEQITKLRPGIKVIYMSGYTDQAVVHHGILAPDTVLLQKPFTLNALAAKLRAALEVREKQDDSQRREIAPVLGSGRSL